MSTPVPAVQVRKEGIAVRAPWRRWSARRWRRAVNMGCVPLTLLCSAGVSAAISLAAFNRPPGWVLNTREWMIAGRLGVSAAVLIGVQAMLAWGIGLAAARGGALAARGYGGNLHHRLRIARRRLVVPTIALVMVRVGVLGVIGLAAIFAYLPWGGMSIATGLPALLRPASGYGLFVLAAVVLAIPHWLIGPFLRLRYSVGLGALAGTWAKHEADRVALAFSALLGAGLAGVLALLWGWSSGLLVLLTLVNPSSYRSAMTLPNPYGALPPFQAALPFAVGIFTLVYAAGQLVLAETCFLMARRRLARRRIGQTPPPPGGGERGGDPTAPARPSASG